MSVSGLWQGWCGLWFREVDARSLGVMRIGLGLILVLWHLSLWPDLELLVAPWGAVDVATLEAGWTDYRASYLGLVSEPWQLHLVHALGLAVLLAFTAGYQTTVVKWLALAIMVSTWHRNPWIHNGGDRLLRIALFTLALSPCGAALSMDAVRRGARATVPILTHRLIQLQWLVMYTYTGIVKLPGPAWMDGSALYYALSDANYSRFTGAMDTLLATGAGQLVATTSSYVTLGWEVLFAPLVLWRRTRWWALGFGVLVHVGIFTTMSVGIFSLISVWGYLAWVDPERLGAMFSGKGTPPPATAVRQRSGLL